MQSGNLLNIVRFMFLSIYKEAGTKSYHYMIIITSLGLENGSFIGGFYSGERMVVDHVLCSLSQPQMCVVFLHHSGAPMQDQR
jgi:hypothetical protein